VEHRGRQLLDPTTEPWADHFIAVEDRLLPAAGDRDAGYTEEAYDLNDPRKILCRRLRRELITDRRRLLVELPTELSEVLHLADRLRREHGDLDGFRQILVTLRRYREMMKRAQRDLQRFAAEPADAPHSCRCNSRENHTLPEGLASQTFDLPDLRVDG